ncbi:YhfZ family protein [Paenibacillus spongiae]|uniref:GntR family transcriptional regulator n=1 Tax=Paenibacillus spongiae TaxID=2909671 RepID=A0ABY5SIB6_9BACL|nr:YhfZ family protein [Paenibacillus spongiae]UVI33200.1 GntR family transcriptional regulator [Paenibacillus spongiae]
MKCEVGSKIPTTPELAGMFSVGFGTVDKAMNALKETGAIKLQSKGQLGTIMLEKNAAALWSIIDQGPLVGSLPLPKTIEYEGLATALIEMFNAKQVECNLTFKNGATLRVNQLLEQQCDFIMMSQLSAEQACEEYSNLRFISIEGDNSYYSDLIVLHRKDNSPDMEQWRIGLDPASYDHIALSDQLFSSNEKINIHYGNIPYLIADGIIDAAIWHSSQLVPTSLIEILAVKRVDQPQSNSDKSMAAAIVINKERKEIHALFDELCDVELIGKIQQEVITRKRSPIY